MLKKLLPIVIAVFIALTSLTAFACDPGPAISLVKSVDKSCAGVGEQVMYTFTVTNTGALPLSDVTISDELLGLSNLPVAALLEGGHTATYSVCYTIKATDPPTLINISSAMGMSGDAAVTAQASVSIHVLQPGITLKTTVDKSSARVGEQVQYTFTVTNTGDLPLSNIVLSDDMPGFTNQPVAASLEVGASVTYTQDYSIVKTDPSRIINHASATGTCSLETVTAQSSASVKVRRPRIALTTTVDKPAARVGEQVKYTFTVTNTGNLPLTNIVLSDNLLALADQPLVSSLAAGAFATYTQNYIIKDTDPGTLIIKASTTGTSGLKTVTAHSSVTVRVEHANIQIKETANKTTASIGDIVTYTLEVKNTGNVTLTNVLLNNEKLGMVDHFIGTLTANATTIITKTYLAAENDLGVFTNTASVSGKPPLGEDVRESDSVNVTITGEPSISIDKQANKSTVNVGGSILYTFKVKNTGNMTLTDVVLNDAKLGITDRLIGTLTPGASEIISSAYTAQSSDLGTLSNMAAITGKPKIGAKVSAADSVNVSVYSNHAGGDIFEVSSYVAPVEIEDTKAYVVPSTDDFSTNIAFVTILSMLGALLCFVRKSILLHAKKK